MKRNRTFYAVAAASALMTLGASFSALASEWSNADGEWAYIDNSGARVTDTWKESGGMNFYLDSEGYLVRNSLVEVNGSYYYLNSAGAMVTNEWRELENQDWQDSIEQDYSWYYFGDNGRAVRSTDGETEIMSLGGKKYAFDSYGRMLTGWITESAEAADSEDGWQDALYYSDEEDGGALLSNAWLQISVYDDENEDDTEPEHWFYFSSNGKKAAGAKKAVNGRDYYFDERGAAQYGWQLIEGEETWHYYGDEEQCYLKTGWFQAVPDEEMDEDAYNEDTDCWFFAASDGDLTLGQIKTIGSKQYAFNEFGKMFSGLWKLKVEDKEITEYAEILSEDDVPEDEEWGVYYFGDEDGDGAMRTKTATVELDGESYTYAFKASGTDKGRGINGVDDNYIYIAGRRLKAESGTRYQPVTYGDDEYLVNTSGSIQKNKTNTSDADGIYYCTNEYGIITYTGGEKYED